MIAGLSDINACVAEIGKVGPMNVSPDTVDAYVALKPKAVREVLETLRGLVKTTWPEAVEGMKWGAPVYAAPDAEPLVYLYGGRDHANLGFIKGAELDDPDGLLEGKGKSGRHVKCYPGETHDSDALAKLVRQCRGPG